MAPQLSWELVASSGLCPMSSKFTHDIYHSHASPLTQVGSLQGLETSFSHLNLPGNINYRLQKAGRSR